MNDSVIIAGAGPTGLALAIHLAIHDVPVRVLDRAPGPAVTSRALGLQPRGIEVLERIGALGDLPQRSRSLLTMYYNEGGRTMLRLQVGKAAEVLSKPTLLVSQAEVERALRERFEQLGGKVEWSTRVMGAVEQGEVVRVEARIRDDAPAEIVTPWLIGCDGAHSAVRKAAGIGFSGRKLIERLLMVDVRADWPFDPDGSTTWMEAGRMVSLTALPDQVWRVFSEPLPGLPEGLTDQDITDRVLGEFAERSGADLAAVQEVQWATEFRIHRRLADTYRRGRILLAGDAAHIQSPTGGQGQNTGLGDAENLGWKLALVARGLADRTLLDSYEGERRPLARTVLGATSTALGIMLPNQPWKRWIRDRVVLPALRLPVVQRKVWVAASQLGISYYGGPLAPRTRSFTRPRPGDRMPDLPCRGEQVSTVHSEISGRWLVLAESRDLAARHLDAVLPMLGTGFVTSGTVERGLHGDVVLIRPDGHVAWRGREDPAGMSARLTEILWPR